MLQFFALCVFHRDVTVIFDLDMDPDYEDLDVEQMLPFFAHNRIAELELRSASHVVQRFVIIQRIYRHLVIVQPHLDFLFQPAWTPLLTLQLHITASMAPIYLNLCTEACYLQEPLAGDPISKRQVFLHLIIHVRSREAFNQMEFQRDIKTILAKYRSRVQRSVDFRIGFETIAG
jgi:hypothetical protein